jgi:hypothetical protein
MLVVLLLSLGVVSGEVPRGPLKAASSPARGGEARPDPEAAHRIFERFAKLAGEWRGRSTAGWSDRTVFRVIAAGSVVVATSEFEAHPGETMMTMYHLDGDRMMLTHYCVARNQPRLQVSSVDTDLKRVVFTFRDGTNLASRDQGHMDQVVYEFLDEDHFSSRWSFYKEGREDWMEEIHFERIR